MYFFFELLLLSYLSLLQPLLSKLANGAEFLVAHQSGAVDLIIMCLVYLLFIPILGSILVRVAASLSMHIEALVKFIFRTILIAAFFLPLATNLGLSGTVSILATLLLGAGLADYLRRNPSTGRYLSYLTPLSLLGIIWFLFSPTVNQSINKADFSSSSALGATANNTPVVLIIFDEFPLSALLAANGSIDAERFPNFARLAKTSTWYRNSTAVSTHTTLAIPAILTGRYPSPDRRIPVANVHPENIFTALGNSHKMHVWERITRLCPPSLCPVLGAEFSSWPRLQLLVMDSSAVMFHALVPDDLDIGLPEIHLNWSHFWRGRQRLPRDKDKAMDYARGDRVRIFEKYIDEISDSESPKLHVKHTLLPHIPYQFDKDGKLIGKRHLPRAYKNDAWVKDPKQIATVYEALLNQIGACDYLIGQLLDRLQAQGMLEKTLLIVTADHGVTFLPGSHRRGYPEQETFYEDVLLVPNFIKYPNQEIAEVSFRNFESIDIVPTILDVLGVNSELKLDGVSAKAKFERPQKKVLLGQKRGHGVDNSKAFTEVFYPGRRD